MIEFLCHQPFCYHVSEGGKVLASGRLNQNGSSVAIEIVKATDETHDFLFRAMLNVCAAMTGCTIYADLDPSYLIQFGFKPDAQGTLAVKASEIQFPNCSHHPKKKEK